jgi:hypothetical protein
MWSFTWPKSKKGPKYSERLNGSNPANWECKTTRDNLKHLPVKSIALLLA